MSNKQDRERKEMINVFGDPKTMRAAWKSIGAAILQNPASRPVEITDDKGNLTPSAEIEKYSYNKLKRDFDKILNDKDREPTELEMIMQCQIVKARYDTNAAIFVRDTLGAKPVDESKVDAQINNPYENLSDEELEAVKKMRDEKAQKEISESSGTQSIAEGVASDTEHA